MSPLPTQMRDRWQNRVEPDRGHGKIYWHILFSTYPQICTLAKEAQKRLSCFSGLHMTPEKWLHATVLVAGTTDQISVDDRVAMVSEANRVLSKIEPIQITLGRILYHPEAIMLGIQPKQTLDPILRGVQEATRRVTGHKGAINGALSSWTPHITVSYSTAEQPAGPIIDSLGKELPHCDALVNAVSLVVQWGPERLWDWEPVGTVRLGSRN